MLRWRKVITETTSMDTYFNLCLFSFKNVVPLDKVKICSCAIGSSNALSVWKCFVRGLIYVWADTTGNCLQVWEVRRLTEQPLLTSIIQKRRLMLFGHLIRMDESADARILSAVPQSDWRRPVGRPHSSRMATLKNDLSLHNLTYEDAIEMALDKPL